VRPFRVAGVQGAPYPGSREAAVARTIEHVAALAKRTRPDLIVLSELLTVPYFCRLAEGAWLEAAEPAEGPTITAFGDAARRLDTAIVATFVEREGDRCFNSAALISRAGELAGVYRKCHLPAVDSPTLRTDEKRWFSPGEALPVFDLDGVRVGILICYDRSFPEAWRSLMLEGAEIVALPIATFGFRREAFRAELATMAAQSHVFVVAVNKAGRERLPDEPDERIHFGLSCVLGPTGEVLAAAGERPYEGFAVEVDLDEVPRAHELLDWRRDRRPELYGPLVTTRSGAALDV
jgi:beta-ureidopropionase